VRYHTLSGPLPERDEPNPVHTAMRQESRDALRGQTEMQRFTNCSHRYNSRGVCPCSDDEPRKDAY
jgi:hypothetical protein